MARHQETPVFPATYDGGDDDYDNGTAVGSGCGCFRRFCFGQDGDESRSSLLREKEEGGALQEESWLVAQLKNLREFSELVAGPKWKNLIRKMGRICNPRKQNKTAAHFQYSPESYALNFSGGADHEEDGELLHSFSTRFAPGYFINNDHQRKPAAL
ncbi:hypothetical protein C2S52_010542 [Perilla frutescens var. hirtella]|nr:hypothetical protein C2S52_010542 [Perilla frutescens var. hirtella]